MEKKRLNIGIIFKECQQSGHMNLEVLLNDGDVSPDKLSCFTSYILLRAIKNEMPKAWPYLASTNQKNVLN